MSAITDNPSNISRGRASSRYLRSYQKVSEANLDERAVMTYLKKHHLPRTITTFMAELHFQNHIQPIIQVKRTLGRSLSEEEQSTKAQCNR
jgi:hypothetical protein